MIESWVERGKLEVSKVRKRGGGKEMGREGKRIKREI